MKRTRPTQWDEYDQVAEADCALIRAQDRLQALHNELASHTDVSNADFVRALKTRDKANEQLIAADEAERRDPDNLRNLLGVQ